MYNLMDTAVHSNGVVSSAFAFTWRDHSQNFYYESHLTISLSIPHYYSTGHKDNRSCIHPQFPVLFSEVKTVSFLSKGIKEIYTWSGSSNVFQTKWISWVIFDAIPHVGLLFQRINEPQTQWLKGSLSWVVQNTLSVWSIALLDIGQAPDIRAHRAWHKGSLSAATLMDSSIFVDIVEQLLWSTHSGASLTMAGVCICVSYLVEQFWTENLLHAAVCIVPAADSIGAASSVAFWGLWEGTFWLF